MFYNVFLCWCYEGDETDDTTTSEDSASEDKDSCEYETQTYEY